MTAIDSEITEALAIVAVETMSTPELLAAKAKIEAAQNVLSSESNKINSQIEQAHAKFSAHGEPSEPDWWKRVNAAKRAKAWQRQRLQEKIGAINRALRDRHHVETMRSEDDRRKTRDRIFIQIAKLHLPTETYQKLWRLVEETEQQ
jgi:hypothetical protein